MNRKQWRCYDRCLLGLEKWKELGVPVRFLTLTLPACNGVYSPEFGLIDGGRPRLMHDYGLQKKVVQICFRVLLMRMVRKFGNIPYFSVRTAEGNGVIHLVLACEYIPFQWIMEQWVEIAGTCYIWINDPYKRRRTPRDVSKYLIAQYIGDQPDFTYGWSRDWVYGGFSKDFDKLRSSCRDFSRPPIVVLPWCEVYPVDYRLLRDRWRIIMDEKVYNHQKGFQSFMADVKRFSDSTYGFPW